MKNKDADATTMKVLARNKVQIVVSSERYPGKQYNVRKINGNWRCDCLAMKFHLPSKLHGCKHMRLAKVRMAAAAA